MTTSVISPKGSLDYDVGQSGFNISMNSTAPTTTDGDGLWIPIAAVLGIVAFNLMVIVIVRSLCRICAQVKGQHRLPEPERKEEEL